jgi:hypothetical protein
MHDVRQAPSQIRLTHDSGQAGLTGLMRHRTALGRIDLFRAEVTRQADVGLGIRITYPCLSRMVIRHGRSDRGRVGRLMASAGGHGGDVPTVGEVIGRLGPGLVSVAVVPEDSLDRPLIGVTVNDPLLPLPALSGHVLLGVGVDAHCDTAADLLATAAALDYVAIVLHVDGSAPEPIAMAARRHGIVLLTARSGVPWVHLATMFRVGSTSSPHDDQLAGVRLGDLFGFANSLAATISGAVTLEDPQ